MLAIAATQSGLDVALQVIPAIAAVATSVGLLFAALAFKQNRRAHNAGLTKQFFDEWFGQDLAVARGVLRSERFQRALTETHQDIHHFTQSLGGEDAAHLRSLLSFFDRVGWFAAADHLNADHILGPMHHIVAALGKQLVPLIETSGIHAMDERSLTESPIYYAGFRWLYLRSETHSQAKLLKKNFRHPSLFNGRKEWKRWTGRIESRAVELSKALAQPFVDGTYEDKLKHAPGLLTPGWVTLADAYPARYGQSKIVVEARARPFAYDRELEALVAADAAQLRRDIQDETIVRVRGVRTAARSDSRELSLSVARDTYRAFLATNGRPEAQLPGSTVTVRQRYLSDVRRGQDHPALCGALGVNVTVVSSDQQVLLLRRSQRCPLWPGRWTTAIGETVNYDQDRVKEKAEDPGSPPSRRARGVEALIDVWATAIRGAEEELGLSLAAEDIAFSASGAALNTEMRLYSAWRSLRSQWRRSWIHGEMRATATRMSTGCGCRGPALRCSDL